MKRGLLPAAPCKKRPPACVGDGGVFPPKELLIFSKTSPLHIYPCGTVVPSFQKGTDFCRTVLPGILWLAVLIWNHTGTRMLVLLALLLLAFPLLLTFAKFVELPPLADSNHQLERFSWYNLYR